MVTSLLFYINKVIKYGNSEEKYVVFSGCDSVNLLPHDLSDSDGVGWLLFAAAKRFYTCRLRGAAGGGTMIDLSHLSEEEQGVIMTVLRRDTELKKAEEERIG